MNPSKTRRDPPAPDEAPDVAPAPEGEEAPTPAPESPASDPAAEAAELRDRWLRAEAELQNVRRRAARDLAESRRAAEEAVYVDVIELLDDLDRALDSASQAGAEPAWLQGVRLAAQRTRDMLARAGVTRIEAEGRAFDPHVHEALLHAPAPEGVAPGTVVHEIRAGYRRGDRILRAARVAVAAEPGAGG